MEDRVTTACLSDIIGNGWTKIRHDFRKLPHVQPITTWFGFGHDPVVSGQPEDRPPVQRDFCDYAKIRGWTIEPVWDGYDPRKARLSFADEQVDSSIVAHRLAAMLQCWLYFGLLEAVIAKRMHTSHMVRPDSSGHPLLYSWKLTFL